MGRETTQHGRRLDDALQHETRFLEQGAPGATSGPAWRMLAGGSSS